VPPPDLRETALLPEGWRKLPLPEFHGTTLLLGRTDSGKSTLARWLFGALQPRFQRVGWLDADMGQSSLGLPTTLNLVLTASTPSAPEQQRFSFFVGSTSPRGHMLPALVGVQKLQAKASELGADALVVDTTGWIDPAAGGASLKRWKIELLRPRNIVALVEADELETVLLPLQRESWTRLHVLPISPSTRVRPLAERASRRAELLGTYFEPATLRDFGGRGLPVYGAELARPGQLLSLQDEEGFSLALGVLQGSASSPERNVLTPIRAPEDVRSLSYGTLSRAAAGLGEGAG
jgi:polynucleotide 5'-kinase involved in rRNA processing